MLPMKRDEATVATACGADWKTMQARGTARLCDTCDKLVHNLSAMTEREARELLRRPPNQGLCIRYLYDAEGKVWFGSDASEALIPESRIVRGGLAIAASAAALALTPLLMEACGGASPYDDAYSRADAGANAPREPPVVHVGHPSDSGGEAGDGSPPALEDAAEDAADASLDGTGATTAVDAAHGGD
jgi:hypothetical protein